MTSQVPFGPVTPEALAKLTPAEQHAFAAAATYVAGDQKPPLGVIVTLTETVQRLITEPAVSLTDAQCERLRQMTDEWGDAIGAVRRALDLTAALDDADRGIIAAGREALKVLSGEEGPTS
jgi:hypothetical protein